MLLGIIFAVLIVNQAQKQDRPIRPDKHLRGQFGAICGAGNVG